MLYRTLTRTVDPTEELISLKQVQDQCRSYDPEDDAYLMSLIPVAREAVEEYTKRAIGLQTWVAEFPQFPAFREWSPNLARLVTSPIFELARPPLVSVVSIKVLNQEGVQQTLSPSGYTLDARRIPPAVRLFDIGSVSTISSYHENPIEVTYTTGYTAANLPKRMGHAMLLLINHLYEQRVPVSVGMPVYQMPLSYQNLLNPFKLRNIK